MDQISKHVVVMNLIIGETHIILVRKVRPKTLTRTMFVCEAQSIKRHEKALHGTHNT
jgi:hypothetical protein